MKRFRVNFLTGLIACGLLLLNLGDFAFAFAAELPAASAAADPGDDHDPDAAGRAVSPLTAAGWNERVQIRQDRHARSDVPDPISFRPSCAPRRSTLPSHLMERAAAAPRAPAFRA